MIRLCAAALLLAAVPAAAQRDAAERSAWNAPTAPFRIVGDVYYVGTAELASFLIADSAGLVLIDGGLPESAPLIAANIRRLGFRMHDIRYLLINHSHFDHAGGLAALQRASGARLVASRGDTPDLIAGRTVDRRDLSGFAAVRPAETIADGGTIRVGGIVLTAHLTPGHTDGATSWSLRTRLAGKPVEVLFLSSLSVAGRPLVAGRPPRDTPAVAQFRTTFRRLATLRADVVLSYHAEQYDLTGKRRRLAKGDAAAFVDRDELARRIAADQAAFVAEYARQRRGAQS